MKIDIIDDFLTDYQANSLIKTFGESKFPWFFVDGLNYKQRKGNYYFNHLSTKDLTNFLIVL